MSKRARPMPRKKAPQKAPNGAGSVYWSAAMNRYVGAITIAVDGRRTLRRVKYGPKGDESPTAKLRVTEELNKLRARKQTAEGRTRFGEFLAEWFKNADHLRARTRVRWNGVIEGYIQPNALSRVRLSDIERTDIRDFFKSIAPRAPRLKKDGTPMRTIKTEVGLDTKRLARAIIHRVLQEAVDLEIIERNPADKFKLPKPNPERLVWQPEEALFFLEEARGHRLYVMFLLALTTTMGPSELFGLQKSDLNLKGGYLLVQHSLEEADGHVRLVPVMKNNWRRRRIDLPPLAIEALRDHLKGNLNTGGFVFTSPKGEPLRQSNLRRNDWLPLIKRIAEKADAQAAEGGQTDYRFPRITFYGMRHTCNALMGYIGVPIDVARARMGHSSITTTVNVYGHLYQQQGELVARKFEDFLAPLRRQSSG